MEYLKLDWLSFTYKPMDFENCDPFIEFKKIFRINDDELTEGFYRSPYSNVVSLKGIWICYNNYDPLKFSHLNERQRNRLIAMGVHVSIPSSVLGYWFNRCGLDSYSDSALVDMVKFLKARNCKISRLDLCYDDFDKTYSVEYYRQKWVDDCLESPYINSVSCVGSTTKGLTMYFGSLKKRDKVLRIYDKDKESNGEIKSIRYEFELHGEGADMVANQLLVNSDLVRFSDFLYKWVKVKDFLSVRNCFRIQDAKIDSDWFAWVLALNEDLTLKSVKLSRPHPIDDNGLISKLSHSTLRQCAGFIKCFGFNEFETLVNDCLVNDDITDKYKFLYQRLLELDFVPCFDDPFSS